jgi:hypothetical protein
VATQNEIQASAGVLWRAAADARWTERSGLIFSIGPTGKIQGGKKKCRRKTYNMKNEKAHREINTETQTQSCLKAGSQQNGVCIHDFQLREALSILDLSYEINYGLTCLQVLLGIYYLGPLPINRLCQTILSEATHNLNRT